MDMDSWTTSSWVQFNAHPSVLLHRWNSVLCITDDMVNSRAYLLDLEMAYYFQSRYSDGGALSACDSGDSSSGCVLCSAEMKRIGPVPPNRLSNTKQHISSKEIGGSA